MGKKFEKKTDRRIRRTRKLLQDALILLLRQKPLAKIQIKEIVEVADVARPTFYQHFQTKEQLLFSHIDELFENISQAVFVEMDNEDTLDFRQLLITSFQQWQLHHEAMQWVLQVDNKDLFIAALHSHIEMLRQEFERVVQPSTELSEFEAYTSNFFAGGLYMLLKIWIDNGMQESAETMGTLSYLLISNEIFYMRFDHLYNGSDLEQRQQKIQTLLRLIQKTP